MLNQVKLMGRITEIYSNTFEMSIDGTNDVITIFEVDEDTIAMLLLNNIVVVDGHIKISNNHIPNVVIDNLTILDKRGKRND